ncbi:hypothetical protein TorRG33x02_180300 [Trema orientale]|uniref:Uncharacterized protein n=1 Tax=Trema orientale TaxID=63057 RepID=A0A2P5EKS3_TREOI|nr:hypothetical protein TorRG33x02_180300 [Trema orientale]
MKTAVNYSKVEEDLTYVENVRSEFRRLKPLSFVLERRPEQDLTSMALKLRKQRKKKRKKGFSRNLKRNEEEEANLKKKKSKLEDPIPTLPTMLKTSIYIGSSSHGGGWRGRWYDQSL